MGMQLGSGDTDTTYDSLGRKATVSKPASRINCSPRNPGAGFPHLVRIRLAVQHCGTDIGMPRSG
jgi:hypothetical protein